MYDTQITLTGWIGGDVTLREVTEGRQVASFRVACTPTPLPRRRVGQAAPPRGTP